jgi:hypothetical protein
MRSWVFGVIPLVLAALIGAEYFATPRPDSSRALLASLARELRFTYHDCVPLGWQPVPVRGTYYPGYTASAANYAEWLDALWRGRIAKAELREPQAHSVFTLLNHLVNAGLLSRRDDGAVYRYFMTPQALPYYYASSVFHDNRDSLPYLCYSTIVPQHIEWMTPVVNTKTPHARWYDLQFTWKPSAAPEWAQDPVVRAHSVELAPLTSPTNAKVSYEDGSWYLDNIYDRGWMMPALSATLRR